MKRITAFLLSSVLAFTAGSSLAFAADDVRIVVNNETMNFAGDQPPVIQNGRTLVPFRAVFEKMGAEVEWYSDSKLCKASLGGVEVAIHIDSTTVSISGKASVESDVPAQIINGRTMVPLRVLSEGVGADVDWNPTTKTITVSSPAASVGRTGVTAPVASDGIGEEEAKSIAFENAGINPSDAQHLSVRIDKERTGDVYDIEFYANGTEFDYEISVATGEIVSMDKDAEGIDFNSGAQPQPTAGGKITSDKAIEIVLADVGLGQDQVSRLRANLDHDDGMEIYEVEFYKDGAEYSYEINAADGKILGKEIDIDD